MKEIKAIEEGYHHLASPKIQATRQRLEPMRSRFRINNRSYSKDCPFMEFTKLCKEFLLIHHFKERKQFTDRFTW
ncbi:hypothetical protein Dimus_037579, partial [Dionaea muscipula]